MSGDKFLSAVKIATIKMEVEEQPHIDEINMEGMDNEELIEADGIGAKDDEYQAPDPLEQPEGSPCTNSAPEQQGVSYVNKCRITALQVQTLVYCASVAVARTLGCRTRSTKAVSDQDGNEIHREKSGSTWMSAK